MSSPNNKSIRVDKRTSELLESLKTAFNISHEKLVATAVARMCEQINKEVENLNNVKRAKEAAGAEENTNDSAGEAE